MPVGILPVEDFINLLTDCLTPYMKQLTILAGYISAGSWVSKGTQSRWQLNQPLDRPILLLALAEYDKSVDCGTKYVDVLVPDEGRWAMRQWRW